MLGEVLRTLAKVMGILLVFLGLKPVFLRRKKLSHHVLYQHTKSAIGLGALLAKFLMIGREIVEENHCSRVKKEPSAAPNSECALRNTLRSRE